MDIVLYKGTGNQPAAKISTLRLYCAYFIVLLNINLLPRYNIQTWRGILLSVALQRKGEIAALHDGLQCVKHKLLRFWTRLRGVIVKDVSLR